MAVRSATSEGRPRGKTTFSAVMGRPSSSAFARTRGCSTEGMRPSFFQPWTVPAALSRSRAICRTPHMSNKVTPCFMVISFGYPEQNVNPSWVETLFGFPVICCSMERAAAKLKELRKSAVPRLTVRALADALDMPLGSYARYESAYDYKKPYLPIELTRKIAGVLSQYSVDPAEVMKLAGLNDSEVDPEVQSIEAQRPQVQFISLQVALPSEPALRDMFRSLLVLVPEGASLDEAAEILARRLPSGLSAIGPVVLDPTSGESTAPAAHPPSRAKGRHASEQPSRI